MSHLAFINQKLEWYNFDRPQEKLKGMTLVEFRESYLHQ
ncbi:IS3 family transposase [Streptococcus oralis]